MPKFGKRSLDNLKTCHDDLQKILYEVIKWYDFSVLEGYRDEQTQNKYYYQGKSKIKFPHGKHNKKPSLAVDIAPYPIDWGDNNRFRALVFFIKGIAARMDIELRLGCDWNNNLKLDENFIDYPHIELRSKLINGKWVNYDE
jgi:peptidoglycan L-alanyl-D-glutamate endopeptidase CwlK